MQRIGNFPKERFTPYTKPFMAIYLDIPGPVLIKSMDNTRAQIKMWPILFVCMSSVHRGTPFTSSPQLQQGSFPPPGALRDSPQKVVSDRGSQLTVESWLVT